MKSVGKIVLIIAFVIIGSGYGKRYTRCGLTQELINQKFPRTFIGNWVCLIESESEKNTSKMTNKANGSKSLGLFQINSKEWCTFQKPGGKCNVKCEDLIDEKLDDDSSCAKKVEKELGFKAWEGWRRSCSNRNLPLPNC